MEFLERLLAAAIIISVFVVLFKYIIPLMLSIPTKITGKAAGYRVNGKKMVVQPGTYDDIVTSMKQDFDSLNSSAKKAVNFTSTITTSMLKDNTRSKLEKLDLLASLKERGAISDNEYEILKGEIMQK